MDNRVTTERVGLFLRTLLELLLEYPDGLPARPAIEIVAKQIQLTNHEAERYASGRRRFDTFLSYATVAAVKSGWMKKANGIWSITDEGRVALRRYTNPGEFYRVAYRYSQDLSSGYAHRAKAKKPSGRPVAKKAAPKRSFALSEAMRPTGSEDVVMLSRKADEVFVPVHYATNREPTGKGGPNKFYGAERSSQLHFGRLVVSIPKSHKMGAVERPTVWRLWRESADKDIVLRTVYELDEDEFFQSVAAEVNRLDVRNAFVFIHGFNVDFASAAHRAAQMAYDLFLVGEEEGQTTLSVVPILFSWPSEGKVSLYPHDVNNADASVPLLKKFLEDVAQRSGAESITVIAHSMGNRLLTTALKEIGLAMQSSDGPIVREIILAAPDIDRDVFEQAAAAVMRTGSRVTLYASDRDKALKASMIANGYPRAGDSSNGILVIGGIDSIDASTVGDDLLAHSYVGKTDVLRDLHAIITHGASPTKRFGLVAVGRPPNRFWRIRAGA